MLGVIRIVRVNYIPGGGLA